MKKCPRCENEDPNYFYKGKKGEYCRKCVGFKRILLTEELNPLNYDVSNDASDYKFTYSLTKYQKEVSIKTLDLLKNKKDVLLHCVCGAGKTEIVVDSISYFLSLGLRVCYAISRREVVIELTQRFKTIFKFANVVSVYGDNHKELIGDLIVCTTHQLFRYYKTFDLLIIDEVDAFPLSGNETLMNIAINSCKGNLVFSTATVNKFLKDYLSKREFEEVRLYIRPSLKPLCVPKVIYNLDLVNLIILFLIMKKEKNQTIVFVSSKSRCRILYLIFSKFFNCTYVYSDLNIRNQNIKDFKDKKYQFIFSTTVLERGITIKDVDVVISFDRDKSFDKSAIIQMAGRVGRGVGNSDGKVIILSSCKSKDIDESIKEIKEANEKLAMSIL